MKRLLIINPRAGKYKKIREDIEKIFSKTDLTIKETKKKLHARELAKKAVGKYDVVIVAGGDGTINEVINGIAGTKVKVGIIPNGTENVIAQELGIPKDHKKAAKVVLKGKTKTYDLGKANGRYFMMMTGIGLDAKAAKNVDNRPVLKKMLGRGMYHVTAIQTYLTDKPSKLKIWLDDQILPRWGYYAIVGNIKLYGGNLKLTPIARPDDGYLDICIFKNKDIFSMMKYFVGATYKNKIIEMPSIEYFRVKKIKIESEKKVLAHTDAEIIGTTPVEIEAIPKSIKIIS